MKYLKNSPRPVYTNTMEGVPNNPTFTAVVTIDNQSFTGVGKKLKEAENKAAAHAYIELTKDFSASKQN